MRDDEFMVGSWSNRPRIGIDAPAVRRIFLCFWSAILRGRRSIWSGWREMPVAPRIVNDVAYVTKINHESHFAWQAQYLVMLEGDACCSAHCK